MLFIKNKIEFKIFLFSKKKIVYLSNINKS